MAGPIPIALLEGDQGYARHIRGSLFPEFDVVMVCPDPEGAVASLAPVLSGNLEGPGEIFGVGSNSEAPPGERKRPRAVILTGRLFPLVAEGIRGALRATGAVVEQMQQGEREEAIGEIRGRLMGLVQEGILRAD